MVAIIREREGEREANEWCGIYKHNRVIQELQGKSGIHHKCNTESTRASSRTNFPCSRDTFSSGYLLLRQLILPSNVCV